MKKEQRIKAIKYVKDMTEKELLEDMQTFSEEKEQTTFDASRRPLPMTQDEARLKLHAALPKGWVAEFSKTKNLAWLEVRDDQGEFFAMESVGLDGDLDENYIAAATRIIGWLEEERNQSK